MVRKLLFLLVLLLAANATLLAQSGALQGKVIDKMTKEPIPFTNIIIEFKGTQAGGTASDFDGKYTIKPITPGTYDVKASFLGYKPVQITGIPIRSGIIEYLNIELESTAVQVEGVTITKYKVPLIDKDKTVSGATVTSEEISKMPSRNAASIATSVGGVFSRDGEVGSVRGQRSDGNVTYIDGIKVRGSGGLPESAIEQVSVILGGVPAQYGDATGGIINITTKGPSRQFGGGLELQTSQFLDPYGSHRVGLNFTGPLFWNKDKTEALLGYFIAGDFNYNKDGATLPLGAYKVNDAKLAELEANPLRPSGTGSGTYQNVEFIRESDLVALKSSLNCSGYDINTSGKLDVKTGKNTNLTFGGSYRAYAGENFSLYNSIFNYKRNSYSNGNEWRVFGRFTQRFPASKEGNNLVKNIYYSIQADYTSIQNKTQDAELKDNLFAYGYVGKFDTYKEKGYDEFPEFDTTGQLLSVTRTMNGFADTLVTFQRAEFNPVLANYTDNFYKYYAENNLFLPFDPNHTQPFNREEIYSGGGMLNGYTPNGVFGGVYSLWSAPGNQQSGYGKNSTTQVTANMNLSADVGNHEIKLGFTFEKYSQSSFSYAPTTFWQQMYQLTNSHIIQLNLNDSMVSNYQDVFGGDTVNVKQIDYSRLYDGSSQSVFDMNLRTAMGLPAGGTEWIDVNSYDLNSNTISYFENNNQRHTVNLSKPVSVDFFSPDEFLNISGNAFAAARGYDYYGNKLTSSPSIMDYYDNTDANGNYTRQIKPNEPIYMAGYISDKFSFDDLVFNVGVRVDRFDANQSTLKDPYSLYPVKTVADVTTLGEHPLSMGDNYAVYVDNLTEPTRVMGYRDGSNWYDANGAVLIDPTFALDAGNGITPFLSGKKEINENSFADYVPQISVMPRISFSFPISDEALFYAHYDVITQRPKSYAVMDPFNYLKWQYKSNLTMSNPNLKPEKNVNYELGFQQKISNSSSINISAFYIESRDQIQSYRFTGAYPSMYYSYNNIDFGTVKGLTIAYDLRRTGNVRIRANYTLQFANGTGSNPETSAALIRSGQPNLRNLIPLDADQRHAIQLNVDFRYSEGTDYNGPVISGVQVLKNAGFNITMNGGSGTPYTRSSTISSLLVSNAMVQGSLSGSRLPWSFRMDGRLDKDFTVGVGKDSNGNKKEYFLNAYLQVLNILNTQNIMGVYAATGNPDDDGYLAAAEYQSQINAQLDTQSYRDMYSIAVNSPYNYSSPRMIRLGIGISF
jgi:outer membrane receptor protein involved in Fe transport